MDRAPRLGEVAVPVGDHLTVVPSGGVLSALEQKLAEEAAPGRTERLLGALDNLKERPDFVLMDCPPSAGILTFNALVAAQEVIVPLETSYLAMRQGANHAQALWKRNEDGQGLQVEKLRQVKAQEVENAHDRQNRHVDSKELLMGKLVKKIFAKADRLPGTPGAGMTSKQATDWSRTRVSECCISM